MLNILQLICSSCEKIIVCGFFFYSVGLKKRSVLNIFKVIMSNN